MYIQVGSLLIHGVGFHTLISSLESCSCPVGKKEMVSRSPSHGTCDSGSLLGLPPPNMIARYAVEKNMKGYEMEE